MITLYLSPSTQEKNVGHNQYGTEEEQMNNLADRIQNILENNYEEFLVLRNNPHWKLSEVVVDSNYYPVDLHLALHSNANNRHTRRCEVFCHKFDTQSHHYANIFYKNLAPLTPTSDRGVKEGFNFYGTNKHMFELYKTKANAVLIEVAFHDNIEDSLWILRNLDLIAENIVDSILEIFEIKKKVVQEQKFFDIQGHWAESNINDAYRKGLVKGFPDGTFRPDERATRAEMTTMILTLYNQLKKG